MYELLPRVPLLYGVRVLYSYFPQSSMSHRLPAEGRALGASCNHVLPFQAREQASSPLLAKMAVGLAGAGERHYLKVLQ